MKFSLHFGNLICPDPTEAKKLAIAAETAGFESVIAVEHVVIPSNYSTKYPTAKQADYQEMKKQIGQIH